VLASSARKEFYNATPLFYIRAQAFAKEHLILYKKWGGTENFFFRAQVRARQKKVFSDRTPVINKVNKYETQTQLLYILVQK
jgi:hypothetical protein